MNYYNDVAHLCLSMTFLWAGMCAAVLFLSLNFEWATFTESCVFLDYLPRQPYSLKMQLYKRGVSFFIIHGTQDQEENTFKNKTLKMHKYIYQFIWVTEFVPLSHDPLFSLVLSHFLKMCGT